ncbi:NAD(P)H-dependent oxidoreductase [Pseudomonas sp. A4002]|jgi:FMN-dependent NADH-azoreductase|uniref:FMN-dependent NADH-azoreductase n=1 Tax=unclassified Pseudomonas TaxID=196821 RepID=UPI0015A427A8|nr:MULTISPECIES: NAD(P)H-dependent oxidoreductase [unclassified Pseudomonas]NVZ36088.1 NAD(P)H-dependent oxidoreductase [Pseudomonas sp. A4002]NWB83083.1 NAD(P)H-dependent oxidoreductase [Pseudomonas sp. F9001]
MTTLLHIDVSNRGDRSLSRSLSEAFVRAWIEVDSAVQVIVRDIGVNPPPFITDAWLGAVFTAPSQLTVDQVEQLKLSDMLIEEIDRADVIVIGSPMHNYGMPAALKAWFDQVIRAGKTFTFDLARGDFPVQPIMHGKTLVFLSSRGEFGFNPGGIREKMNHLDPHVKTCADYLGVDKTYIINVEFQGFGDARHTASKDNAFKTINSLAAELVKNFR